MLPQLYMSASSETPLVDMRGTDVPQGEAKLCVHMVERHCRDRLKKHRLARFSVFCVLYIFAALQTLRPRDTHTSVEMLRHAEASVKKDWREVRTLAEADRWLEHQLPEVVDELKGICPRCEVAVARRPARQVRGGPRCSGKGSQQGARRRPRRAPA